MPDTSSPKLTYGQRHPIQKQAFDDAIQLSWQQIGVPALGALGSLIVTLLNEYNAGRLHDLAGVKSFVYSLAYALLIGVVLYVIVAIVRAPFIVIGRQHRQLLELEGQVSDLAVRPLSPVPSYRRLPEPPAETAPRKVTKTVEIDPNIQSLDPEVLIANEQADGIIVEGEIVEYYVWPEDSKNIGVLALPFQNRIPENKPIGVVDYVVARVVIRSFDSDMTQELNRVAWLSEESHRVYFGQGDTRKLIILAFEGRADDPHISAIRRDSPGTRRGFQSQRLRLTRPDELLSFTVSLLHEGTSALIRKTEYILELSLKPEFTIQFTRAYFWKRQHLSELHHQGHELVMQFYEVQTEFHEKGKVSETPFDPALMAERNEKEKALADQVKVWEQNTAAFVGRIFGPDEKKIFLELIPSVELGLKRERKRWPALIRPRLSTQSDEYVSPNWDLSDSISVRQTKLNSLAETVKL